MEIVYEVWYQVSYGRDGDGRRRTGPSRLWEVYRDRDRAHAEAEKIGAWFGWVEIREAEYEPVSRRVPATHSLRR